LTNLLFIGDVFASPGRSMVARHGAELHGVVVEVDEATGRAAAIRRITLT
jgi:calcineurin-like phosphoesterase